MITLSTKKLFTDLAKMSQEDLKANLVKFLKKHYKTVVEAPSYIYAIGDIDIAVAAHLDTIFDFEPEVYCDMEKGVFWSPHGLGADDRAGVFAIVKLIHWYKKKPHVIFTLDEEVGGLGAQHLAAIPNPFPNLKYIIQLDRRGERDCVFYNCGNEDFIKYVESFGFMTTQGSFSDISFICPKWDVAGVNLSIGYLNEHTKIEFLVYKWMWATIQKVIKMLEDVDNISNFSYKEKLRTCFACGKALPADEGFDFTDIDKSNAFICYDCIGGKMKYE